jgi:hypothetical protein
MSEEHSHPDHEHSEQEMWMEEIYHWLQYGVKMGYCGPAQCHQHDGKPPSNVDEHGCALWVRIYKTIEEMDYVEANDPYGVELKKRYEH